MPTPITDLTAPGAAVYPIAITADEEWLTVPEVAGWLRICEEQVRRMCRERRLAGVREGRAWLIPKKANVELLNARFAAAMGLAPEPGPAHVVDAVPQPVRKASTKPPKSWGRATRARARTTTT